MGEIKDIHDRFFKKLFFKEENVKDFLKQVLPADIVSEINFDKIKKEYLLDFKYILFDTNDLEIGS